MTNAIAAVNGAHIFMGRKSVYDKFILRTHVPIPVCHL